MLKFLLELVYMCSFEFVVHLVNVGGDLSWWSNEWSLFCFQRAHVISGLRHVWSFIALTVMWIVDIYHFYPSLANTLKHSSLSSGQKGAVPYSCFKTKHTENMCYTAGSNNRSGADLKVFLSLMWRVVVQAAMHVLPCRSGVCIVLRWSEEFCWNSPWGISTVHPCFSLENMLQIYTNGFRNGCF